MIYPTRRAIVLALIGAPLSLAVGLFAPGLWMVAAGWIALSAGLVLADACLGANRRRIEVEMEPPLAMSAGGSAEARALVRFARGTSPAMVEMALEAGERLDVEPARALVPVKARAAETVFRLIPLRRGQARFERLWLRWRGPLGLVWKQRAWPLGTEAPIVLDIPAIKAEAIRLFSRDAAFGIKSQLDTGEGSEFHALRDFQAGMDTRTVDWRRSARHGALLAKEFRTERNHQMVFALDAGRLMSEPVAGLPRIDRALNAALLLAFVGLKLGDRVGLYSFDSRPRLATAAMAGTASFPLLQRLAAGIDYSIEETNYTLGLTELARRLERRSLVVVFTDFADSTSAELMVENLGRLLSRHVVLFVAFRDEELEALTRAEPETPDDVSRAVIAHTLLREREVVIARLRRLGVRIVDAPAQRMGSALINSYLELKRKELV